MLCARFEKAANKEKATNKIIEIPFKEAIRSEIQVLDNTSIATVRSCAPCLSSTVGTYKALGQQEQSANSYDLPE